ncbi:MAG TPA: hypothetical protein VJ600_06010 [Holophagaceae bacterium]|nr:hypothetical protein [Holophagaceae bacterium]
MDYTREDWDWIEAEWAFHLHGRSAFLSREDFATLKAWEGEGVPPDLVVHAMGAYFARRAKRMRPRAFVAMAHIEKDVAKAMKAREALARSGAVPVSLEGWERVRAPFGLDPQARLLFEAWKRAQGALPLPDAPDFLECFDAERRAYGALVEAAEKALGPGAEPMRAELRQRLLEAEIPEDGVVWARAWKHHWALRVCEAWGIAG